MYKRILLMVIIISGVGLLLGYGREVLASSNRPVSYLQVGFAEQKEVTDSPLPGVSSRSPETVVLTEAFKLLSPFPIADGHYGRAVLLYGDMLFVGEREADNINQLGRVYVYERDGSQSSDWALTKILTASDGTIGDGFGVSLAIDDETLLVGAHVANGNSSGTGAAYIFERNAGGVNNWGEVAKIVASDGANGDRFSWDAVDIDGDTVVIGAKWDDNNGHTNAGAAYIFGRNVGGANNWGQVKKLTMSNPAMSDRFGIAVAIEGDLVVVGADGKNINGSDSGLVYLFGRNIGGINNWGEILQLSPDTPMTNDNFGNKVAVQEDIVVVSAPSENTSRAGSIYLFSRNAGGSNNWGQTAHLMASDGIAGNGFGTDIFFEGETLTVGSRFSDGVVSTSGAVYIFNANLTDPNQWDEAYKLIASDGALNDQFGLSVSVSGGTIVVGAYLDDDYCPSNANCDSGAVYLFSAVLPSDVAISKTVSAATAVSGQPLTYTIAFTNNGSGIAFGMVITDLIPAAILNPTFTSSGVTITPTGSSPFVWRAGDLAPGAGGVITVTGIISPELTGETTIVNTAVITNGLDITPTNNSSTAVTQVIIPEVSLNASEYVVDEDGGQIMVTVVLSPAQPYLDVAVDYETLDGTALAGEDYTAVSGVLTFTAGLTQAQILVPILDDQVVEPDEIFTLELSNPVHAALGNIVNTTITIVDDDTYPELNLSASEYTVLEDAGQVTLTAILSAAYPETVTVEYETLDGTAGAGEDFTAVTGILTFTAGMTMTNIAVPILDDQVVEGDETFTFALSNPVHATMGGTAVATVLIEDDDVFPVVTLSTAHYIVPEDVGEAVITVTLSQPYPLPVSLAYDTVDDTAVAGDDYAATSGTLTMTVGMTQTSFTILVIDDLLVETDETLSILLTNLSNGIPGTPFSATITILDNDEEPLPPIVSYLYLPIIIRHAPTPPPPAFPIWISSSVTPRPVISQGEIFYTATITIPADLPSTGQFFLSAASDDLLVISVDDELAFVLDGEDLFVKRFSLDGQTIYPEIVPIPRQTLALMAGQTVTVVFRDVFSDQVSATPIWLIHIP